MKHLRKDRKIKENQMNAIKENTNRGMFTQKKEKRN
jgi:hypothetical protein